MGFFSRLRAFLPAFLIFCAFPVQKSVFAADPSKYISVDEVRTDMDAYCLTVFHGTQVEKFPLKILSVVRNHKPGQDMILVIGTDERFQHSSAVHGCSGSPVYIDGRLAGALAAGWDGSLDSLYLVRPIEDMLAVGTAPALQAHGAPAQSVLSYDFNKPLDLAAYYQDSMARLSARANTNHMYLPLSGTVGPEAVQQFAPALKGMGFLPVAGASQPAGSVDISDTFEPGGVLALVLCGGDISLAATGTVTDIVGDQVFGFGHSFNGEGPVNLPIAAGKIHTVVASRTSSFKFSSPGPVLGTLMHDQSSAVRGTMGQKPNTIPLRIDVESFNDPQERVYDCFLAKDRSLTPMILQVALNGAGQMQGSLPYEHTVRYRGQIDINGSDPIRIDNISSGENLSEMIMDAYSAVGLLMNNPFEEADIKGIDVRMTIEPKNTSASIWSVNVSNTRVRPGQTLSASVQLRSYRAMQESVTIDFDVPENLAPGKYMLMILGAEQYQAFVNKTAPQKFRAFDFTTLKSGLSDLLAYRRDRLYAVMAVPATGVVFRQHELSHLPPTRMLLMQDAKRVQPLEPYKAWAENSIQLDKIVQGAAQIELIVEERS